MPSRSFSDRLVHMPTSTFRDTGLLLLGSIRAAVLSLLPATRESFPGGPEVKNQPAMQDTRVQSLDQEDPMDEGMTTHYSILAWRSPWTEEPGRLQS